MELIFTSYSEIHIKQFHGMLLKYSSKDERHRGEYKKFPNSVEAFGSDGKSLEIIPYVDNLFVAPTGIFLRSL